MPQESRDPIAVAIPETLWEPHVDEEAVLAEWLAQDGAPVEEGDVIAVIMVEKVTMDVERPARAASPSSPPPTPPSGPAT